MGRFTVPMKRWPRSVRDAGFRRSCTGSTGWPTVRRARAAHLAATWFRRTQGSAYQSGRVARRAGLCANRDRYAGPTRGRANSSPRCPTGRSRARQLFRASRRRGQAVERDLPGAAVELLVDAPNERSARARTGSDRTRRAAGPPPRRRMRPAESASTVFRRWPRKVRITRPCRVDDHLATRDLDDDVPLGRPCAQCRRARSSRCVRSAGREA